MMFELGLELTLNPETITHPSEFEHTTAEND